MKKSIALAMAFALFLPCFALAQLRVLVTDPNGSVVIDNLLEALEVGSIPPVLTLKLRNPVALPAACPQAKINISAKVLDSAGNLVKDWGLVGTILITPNASVAPLPTPVSPAPIPSPLIRPTPPFPNCYFGPAPTDKSDLIAYIGEACGAQNWADWLKANPQDLDWVWSEYKKTNQ
jgi:hypothetical protein